MQRRSANPVISRAALDALLEDLAGTVGLADVLDGAILRLFTNAFTPNPDQIPADFTEATFGGYASVTPLTFSDPGNVADEGLVTITQSVFTAAAPVGAGETIEGYYLENAGGTAVLLAERFVTPVPIAVDGDFLELDIYLQLPFTWPVTQL